MKKIVVLSALISIGTLINAANQPQQPKLSLDQYLQRLNTQEIPDSEVPKHINQLIIAKKDLESQLPSEIKKRISELDRKIMMEQFEAIASDSKALTDFGLGFNLSEKTSECAKNNKKACAELKEFSENLKLLQNVINTRHQLTLLKAKFQQHDESKQILEDIQKNSPEAHKILMQMGEVDEKISQLMFQIEVQNKQQ